MKYQKNTVKDLKIAYIGGGSRGWAWTLMNDLAGEKSLSGEVALYDIDRPAAEQNAVIGKKIAGDAWHFSVPSTLGEALTGADFVVISILPGTFDEMAVDVHAPEKYGILQSVGDTAGPGGFIRALRTVPMMRKIASAVREFAPRAIVINYTNPMAVCVGALYREFPEIRAYGCCHEVFDTQKLLTFALEEIEGIQDVKRSQIAVNVVGVNHFTWFTTATYHGKNIFDTYARFVDKFHASGYSKRGMGNWMNDHFANAARVRMDLFRRFGYIAAAGDRHLSEFMDNTDYLTSCDKWMFGLTPVSWRKDDLVGRMAKGTRLFTGEECWEHRDSGEEGVAQMHALLGLSTLVTNINLPNRGQIANLPMGAIVETNAVFRDGGFAPVFAGAVPDAIYPLIARASRENERMLDAAFSESRAYAKELFASLNMLKALTKEQKSELFDTMWEGTKGYLGSYT